MLKKISPIVNPPIIILNVLANDFTSNTVGWHSNYPQPYALLKEGKVEIVHISEKDVKKRRLALLLKESALFRLISKRGQGKNDVADYPKAQPVPIEEQMLIMEDMMLRFRDLTDEIGSHLVVVLLPGEVQFNTKLPVPDPDSQWSHVLGEANLLSGFSEDFNPDNLEQQEALAETYSLLTPPMKDHRYERLVEFGKDNSIDIVDLTSPLYEIYSSLPLVQQNEFYCDYVHFNYTGHGNVAYVIGELMPIVLSEGV